MNHNRGECAAVGRSLLWLAAALLLPQLSLAAPDPFAQSKGTWGQDFADQWALSAIGLSAGAGAHTQNTPGFGQVSGAREVIVAVIDTGVDYTHEDFDQAALWRNPNERANGRDDDNNGLVDDLLGWNFAAGNNNPWDDSGHGTHVAGLIAACTNNGVGIAGVSPGVRLLPLKVAEFDGQAKSANVAAAMDYAVASGAHIINLSLNGNNSTELERAAAQRALDAGVLLVVAAGNHGVSVDDFSYGALPGALIVGATTPQGTRAGFSNFGRIDLVAPGVDVLSLRAEDTDFIAHTGRADYEPLAATPPGHTDYYRASGTSFAAAIVSGVAARLLQVRPTLALRELRQVLTQSARDLGLPGTDQLTGYGAVDFTRAHRASAEDVMRARLTGVDLRLQDETIWVRVDGVAHANALHSASLQFAAGDSEDWQTLSANVTPSREPGPLTEFSLNDLLDAQTEPNATWTLRLLLQHENGQSREARLQLALPAVQDEEPEL